MEIHEFIKERRKALGLSLQTVGDAINYTPQAIRKFESGTVNIDIRLVEQLIKILNVSLTCFLNADISNIEEYKEVGSFDADKFCTRLRFLREQEKITQADFAKLVDIAKGRISKIENGESFPSVLEFIRIADHFNIDYEELYFGIVKKEEKVEETSIHQSTFDKKSKLWNRITIIALTLSTILLLTTSIFLGVSASILKNDLDNIEPGATINPNGQVSNYHTVTYDFDLSGEEIKESVYHGKQAPNLEYRHEGYELIGYYLNDSPFNFDTPINDDIKITGKLKKKKFDVVFYDFEGEQALRTTAEYLDSVTPPDLPPIANKKFQAWSSDEYLSVKKNLSIYPKYSSVVTRAYYNLNKGRFVDPDFPKYKDNFKYSDLATLPSIIKEGYRFAHFTLAGQMLTPKTALDDVVTLDAVYKANDYTITFNECYLEPINVAFGDSVSLPRTSIDGKRKIKTYYDEDFKEVPFEFVYNYDRDLSLTPLFEGNKLGYEKIPGKNEIELTNVDTFDLTVVVPEAIDGMPVKAIREGAFKDNESIRHIIIEQNDIEIDTGAFKNLPNLETVDVSKFNTTAKLGTNIFINCPKVKYAKVGLALNKDEKRLMLLNDYGFPHNNDFTLEFGELVYKIPANYNKGFGKIKKIVLGKNIKEVEYTSLDYEEARLEEIIYTENLQSLNMVITSDFKQKELKFHTGLCVSLSVYEDCYLDKISMDKGTSINIHVRAKLYVKTFEFIGDNYENYKSDVGVSNLYLNNSIYVEKLIVGHKTEVHQLGNPTGSFNPYDENGLFVYLRGIDYVPETIYTTFWFTDPQNTFVDFDIPTSTY